MLRSTVFLRVPRPRKRNKLLTIPAVKAEQGIYMVGGRTAVAVTRSKIENRSLEKGLFALQDNLPLKTFPGYENYPAIGD
jgi:hypothetical protein